MTADGEGREDRYRRRRNDPEERMREATRRLEQAARDLAASASDNAADLLDRVADRLAGDANHEEPRYRNRVPRGNGLWRARERRTPRLYRDTERGKLFGVCAGIGNYTGIEPWVVRCIAITGLIFLPSVTLIVYIVGAVVLDKKPAFDFAEADEPRATTRSRTKSRRASPSTTPRDRLYRVGSRFDDVEGRLRRMESYITSGQYELKRELAKLAKS